MRGKENNFINIYGSLLAELYSINIFKNVTENKSLNHFSLIHLLIFNSSIHLQGLDTL